MKWIFSSPLFTDEQTEVKKLAQDRTPRKWQNQGSSPDNTEDTNLTLFLGKLKREGALPLLAVHRVFFYRT